MDTLTPQELCTGRHRTMQAGPDEHDCGNASQGAHSSGGYGEGGFRSGALLIVVSKRLCLQDCVNHRSQSQWNTDGHLRFAARSTCSAVYQTTLLHRDHQSSRRSHCGAYRKMVTGLVACPDDHIRSYIIRPERLSGSPFVRSSVAEAHSCCW